MRYWTSYKYRRRDKSKSKCAQFRGGMSHFCRFYHKRFRTKERDELRKVVKGKEYGFIPEKHRNAAKWDWW